MIKIVGGAIVTSLVASFIELGYEGIFIYLQIKRQKTIQKVIEAIKKLALAKNIIYHLKNQ